MNSVITEKESPVFEVSQFPEIEKRFEKDEIKPSKVWFAGYDWCGTGEKCIRLYVNVTWESLVTKKQFRQMLLPCEIRLSQGNLKRERIANGEQINWQLYREFGEILAKS